MNEGTVHDQRQTMPDWTQLLADRRFGLMQSEPYPVVAPIAVEAVLEIIMVCADHGFNVLPMGSGSSFAPNHELKRDRTLALSTLRMHSASRLDSGFLHIESGISLSTLLGENYQGDRKTLGGLLCAKGNSLARELALEVAQRIRRIEVADARGNLVAYAGPASPNYVASPTSSLFLESRGKAGVVIGMELNATELPIVICKKSLNTLGEGKVNQVLSRQFANRLVEPASLFDW